MSSQLTGRVLWADSVGVGSGAKLEKSLLLLSLVVRDGWITFLILGRCCKQVWAVQKVWLTTPLAISAGFLRHFGPERYPGIYSVETWLH
jgi:hypothetical protein